MRATGVLQLRDCLGELCRREAERVSERGEYDRTFTRTYSLPVVEYPACARDCVPARAAGKSGEQRAREGGVTHTLTANDSDSLK